MNPYSMTKPSGQAVDLSDHRKTLLEARKRDMSLADVTIDFVLIGFE